MKDNTYDSDACVLFCLRLFLIDHLASYTPLYSIDHCFDNQHRLFVMSNGGRGSQRLNTNDYQWQLKYHYKRRTNIVLSDMDTVHPCNRPLVRLLRVYCCEWGCHSVIFEKFQVIIIQSDLVSIIRGIFLLGSSGILYFGCFC